MGEPLSRCTGNCCRRFALDQSWEELQALAIAYKADPTASRQRGEDSDIITIAEMVIPVQSSRNKKEHVFRCKNLGSNGDCGIYEVRPQMCRDFPGPEGCHFRGCKSSQSAYFGLNLTQRFLKRWRWLRSLVKRAYKEGV